MNQLDGTIEIPEILQFVCNDRSELLDQLKVLQMVLRKERDKNGDNVLPSLSSEVQPSSTTTSNVKDNLKEKVEKHKQAMIQKRQDKLKQMDAETHALSKALISEECESSGGTKVRNRKFLVKFWKINVINVKIFLLFLGEKKKSGIVHYSCNKENETDEHREQQSC